MARQVKSKQRVTDHGEVFTADREVNAMLDLVKQETERVDSRFLEPACGDGNFLAEILHRKLEAAKKRAIPPITVMMLTIVTMITVVQAITQIIIQTTIVQTAIRTVIKITITITEPIIQQILLQQTMQQI